MYIYICILYRVCGYIYILCIYRDIYSCNDFPVLSTSLKSSFGPSPFLNALNALQKSHPLAACLRSANPDLIGSLKWCFAKGSLWCCDVLCSFVQSLLVFFWNVRTWEMHIGIPSFPTWKWWLWLALSTTKLLASCLVAFLDSSSPCQCAQNGETCTCSCAGPMLLCYPMVMSWVCPRYRRYLSELQRPILNPYLS